MVMTAKRNTTSDYSHVPPPFRKMMITNGARIFRGNRYRICFYKLLFGQGLKIILLL